MCTPDWRALREGADAAARSVELAERVAAHLRAPLLVRDLGCGTGSMGRWLAPRLPGPQRWVLHDRDPTLLAGLAGAETVAGDVTALRAADLAGTSLVTASALLDLLTSAEADALAAACVDAGCAALFTLSVVGHVELDPPDPLDAALAAAFDAHQRRTVDGPGVGGRRLLGPEGGAAAFAAFARRGVPVTVAPSPWRLDPGDPLAEEWLRGWVDAACAQDPDLVGPAEGYLRRRLAAPPHVVVGHVDVLALP